MKTLHMAKRWHGLLAALAALGLMLSGCGGGGGSDAGGGTASTLSGTAATGAAMVGHIEVTGAGGQTLGSVAINADGSFSADVTGMSGPFLLAALPDDTSLPTQYSYAAAAGVTVNVTPLTTLALFLANSQQDLAAMAASWSSAQIDTTALATAQARINANFASQLSAQGLDPTTYDFFSAGFDTDGNGLDGMLDGLVIDVDMSGGSYSIQVGGASFSFDAGIDIGGIDIGGDGNNNGGTLPSGVSGHIVTMEYCCAASGSLYNNGDQVLFSFSSSGALMLTDQYTVVADSFSVDQSGQYVWTDANAVQYVLSLLNGEIHEVNVMGAGDTFLGQFAPVSSGPGGGTLTPDGDGAALTGGNGATGTIASTTYTYSGHPVAGSPLYTVNPLDSTGLFDAYDGSSAITRWSINGFPAAAGSYSCGANGALPAVSLTLNGVPYQADQCSIEIISASATEVEGRFAAHLQDAGGSAFGTVTDGYFRYAVPATGGGGGLAAGEYGYTMDANDVNVSVTGVAPLDGFDRPVAGYLILGNAPSLQLRMIPDGGVGSYTCGSGPSFREVALWYLYQSVYYYSDNSFGGSCSIEVTAADSVYEGTFSGTLYSNSGDALVITNGFFRNDGSNL